MEQPIFLIYLQGTIECDICKLLVDYAEKYIEENHTIEEINATLRGFCKDLPDFLQDPVSWKHPDC